MFGITDHLLPASGIDRQIRLWIPVPHTVFCTFQCKAQTLFAVAQLRGDLAVARNRCQCHGCQCQEDGNHRDQESQRVCSEHGNFGIRVATHEIGGGHGGVMHGRHRDAHNDGHRQDRRAALLLALVFDEQRQIGKCHRHRDGQSKECGVIANETIQMHGGHAGVMHGSDTGSQEETGEQGREMFPAVLPHHTQCDTTGQDAGNHRHQRDKWIVVDATGQVQCQHADEMHRPDTDTQRERTDQNPGQPRKGILRMRNTRRGLQRGKGSENCEQNRDGDPQGAIRGSIDEAVVRGHKQEM